MNELFAAFAKSVERLDEVLGMDKSTITRDATIQRFEFTIELAWKCLQKFLLNEKIICRSPKECFKEAFKFGLIEDDPVWLAMLDDRNLSVHTYNEKIAEEIYARIQGYIALLKGLKEKLQPELLS